MCMKCIERRRKNWKKGNGMKGEKEEKDITFNVYIFLDCGRAAKNM